MAALAVTVLAVSVAYAGTPGSSPGLAVVKPTFFSDSATLTPVPHGSDVYHEYWYLIPGKAGQTISVDLTTSWVEDPAVLAASQGFASSRVVRSDYLTWNVQHLSLMTPRTGHYYLTVYGSDDGPFAIKSSPTSAVRFTLTNSTTPSSARHGASFNVSAILRPAYNGLSSPVTFFIQRKVEGKWRPYRSAGTTLAEPEGNKFSQAVARLKLPRATFRVRARFTDLAHPRSTYNAWRTIQIR